MKINIPRSVATRLLDVLNEMIFVPQEDKTQTPTERDLPFNLKFKLVKDYNALAVAVAEFEVKREEIIKKYGTENPETHEFSIEDEENKEKARKEILDLLSESIIIDILKVPTKEIEFVSDESIKISSLDILLLQTYLIEKEDN